MYVAHFKFGKPPFTLTPDPSFLFLSRDHQDALAHLLYGIKESAGFVQLTGEVGTGKTTLCRYLLEKAPPGVDVALILNPRQTASEILASICDELKIRYSKGTRSIKDLVDRLNRYLLDRHARGRRTVLVIDEAQNLSPEVLEQIRLLTNLETATTKLLQILLIGQPELREMMQRPDLRQLSQRIIARYHLTPLSREETAAYIRHRLQVAGCTHDLFTNGALKRIHRLSGGVPRLINVLCDRSLLGTYARGKSRVDGAMVRIAEKDIEGEPVSPKPRRRWLRAATVFGTAAVGIVIAVVIWQFGIRGAGSTTGHQAHVPASRELTAPIAPPRSRVPTASEETPDPPIASVDSGRAPLSATAPAATNPPPADREASVDSPDSIGLSEWLSQPGAQTLPENAFTTLLAYWNLDSSSAEAPPDCAQALTAGLRCIQLSSDLAELLSYNRPAILELVDDNRVVHHVVISEVTASWLLLDMAGKRLAVDEDAFSSLWTGRFTLLWRPPPLQHASLVEGMVGVDVLWLRRQLDRVDGLTSEPPERPDNPVFDASLRERVKRFQTLRKIKADGIVGARTLLELNTATGDPEVPLLREPVPRLEKG